VHRGKWWLYLIHRWIGIGACLLFLIWFLSGLVMVYVPYPSLTARERLAGLPAIDWSVVRIGPAEVQRAAGLAAPPESVALEMTADDAVWRVTPRQGPQVTLSAATGERLESFDSQRAARTAGAFGQSRVVEVETLDQDQWTVAGGFDAHRPLHRVRLEGRERRDLYVSSTTGAVVQDTDANERFWNWLGSVPHWIYPTILRQNQPAWRQVVIWVSGPCILVAITGIWIGILRTRVGERRFRGGRMAPYHGWMLWHHVAGLIGGITLTTWIFSGWLSVDPGRVFRSPGLDADALIAYEGTRALPAIDIAQLAAASGAAVKRVEFAWAAGQPWARAAGVDGTTVLDANTLQSDHVEQGRLIAAASRLVPGASIAAVQMLTAPDAYWYELAERPQLPVLRIRFADAAGTWVHLDPVTGQVLGSLDQTRRAYRWFYDLLHKWDLNVLMLSRPLWDLVLWALSFVGIVTSVSGVWIGWRRLRGRQRRKALR
jgi:PepSY-associated TM region